MDDTAVHGAEPDNRNLVMRLKATMEVIHRVMSTHGLTMNYTRGKTGIVLTLRGRYSAAVKTELFGTLGPSIYLDEAQLSAPLDRHCVDLGMCRGERLNWWPEIRRRQSLHRQALAPLTK